MLSLTMLPARQGDALWIRWGDPSAPHQMLIDLGTEEIGRRFRRRLLDLDRNQRAFDLLVITHIDRDHIGGVVAGFAEDEAIPGLDFADVWFNGYAHLLGGSVSRDLEPMGPVHGERLSTWLAGRKWNLAFAGRAVARVPGAPPPEVTLHDGLTLTVLGPTPARLAELEPTWREEVLEALHDERLASASPALEPMGPKVRPDLYDLEDLRLLAETSTKVDDSAANGSSIALLLRYRGTTLLLAGDAFPGDLVDGIAATDLPAPLRLDGFKLPHHGSQGNIVRSLVEAVDCDDWWLSTDGTQFRHPDPVALARILLHGTRRPPRLVFNVPSKYNGWWDDDEWREGFGYRTAYGNADDGLTLSFDVGES